MPNEWDESAAGWDNDKDVVRYADQAFRRLGEIVAPNNLNILDFGCGTGCLTDRLAAQARSIVALDTSLAMLAVLERKGLPNVETLGVELTSKAVAKHPILQSPFDLIVASSVCGFLPDYEGSLALLTSLLAPGGWFIQWDWVAAQGEPGLTLESVAAALENAGLKAITVSTPFSMEGPEGDTPVLMGVGQRT
jgi:predicted TPR repeat methyltransferase